MCCSGQEGSSAELLGPAKEGAISVHVNPQGLSFPVRSSVPSLCTFWSVLERFTAFRELLLERETRLEAGAWGTRLGLLTKGFLCEF